MSFALRFPFLVDVAQLVRALVCGTRGRGFKSRLPPQLLVDRGGVFIRVGFLVRLNARFLPDRLHNGRRSLEMGLNWFSSP